MYCPALLIVAILTFRGAVGSPGGAPAAACDNMTPNHSGTAQTGASPYTIIPSAQTYQCGQSITVTLAATGGNNFRGFLCQARTNVASYSSTVGTLAQTGSVTMNQNCGTGRALTHSENGDKAAAMFTWTPSADHGSVKIVCTFVQVKTTYWVKQESVALTYGGNCNAAEYARASFAIVAMIYLVYRIL